MSEERKEGNVHIEDMIEDGSLLYYNDDPETKIKHTEIESMKEYYNRYFKHEQVHGKICRL